MAIPLQTRLFWRALSAVSGAPAAERSEDELIVARQRRQRLIDLPGAAAIVGRPHPDVLVSMKTASGYQGVDLPVRVYRPSGTADEALPLVVNFHGGSFISGDPRQSEWWCSSVAHGARVVVVSVDYRLAPEHRFPVAAEDCYAATQWCVDNAHRIGADGTRLAVMGDSAGGNLAAVVSLMARDRGAPAIAFQLLIYPVVDFVHSYPSEDENEHAPILGKADLQLHRHYCPGQDAEPYASPLLAPEHSGLPPALIQTAHHDPLRDQGAAYAAALREAGVTVAVTDYVDGVHGYISVPGVVPCSRQALAEAVRALKEALTPRN